MSVRPLEIFKPCSWVTAEIRDEEGFHRTCGNVDSACHRRHAIAVSPCERNPILDNFQSTAHVIKPQLLTTIGLDADRNAGHEWHI